jgi:hypothetical protein
MNGTNYSNGKNENSQTGQTANAVYVAVIAGSCVVGAILVISTLPSTQSSL